jgi:type IV secretion system protein VirD4
MAAAARPQGRLDPPMTAVLDEAPLTCGPIPLHDWTADMGGRGFTLHIAGQSLAQLRDVWGHDRANTILGNTGSLMVFGGIKIAEDLDRISTLCGTHLKQLDRDDRRPVPVMTPAEIGGLPTGTALVIRTGMRPVIGRAPMAWDRRPVRQRHVATVGVGPIEADSTTPPVVGDGRPRLRFIPGGQATGAHDDDDLDADGTDGGRV